MDNDNSIPTFEPMPTNNRFHNLTGQKFGRVTVVGYAGKRKSNAKCPATMWWVLCSCGKYQKTAAGHLHSGHTQSCGCWFDEIKGKQRLKHGASKTREHASYRSMINRCTSPRATGWKVYGGRGIKVCDRWLECFENFLEDMGPRPKGMTLDRIDTNGNYEKSNCRWATKMEQTHNTRRNKYVEFRGELLPIAEVARRGGVCRTVVAHRMRKYGLTAEQAIERSDRHKEGVPWRNIPLPKPDAEDAAPRDPNRDILTYEEAKLKDIQF